MPSKKNPNPKAKTKPSKVYEEKLVIIPGKKPFVARVKESKGIEGCYLQWGPAAKPTKKHPTRRPIPAMLEKCTEACR